MRKKTSRSEKRTNRLIHEKSPYLLQHAQNPVDWYPWGQEAFIKAEKQNKPVFLSIGYSTCHWCHVMEKESFEDASVAALLNSSFIPVKVDREERPDVDGVFMSVCQLLTGRGGWPLTIIMTPDKKPFFAGTYIPQENRFGQTGLIDLLQKIAVLWGDQNIKISESADKITAALLSSAKEQPKSELSINTLHSAYQQLSKSFDDLYGGFGQSPKFPTPHHFFFFFRYWKRTKEPHALEMAEKTLQRMRLGGIFDHIGYGFHRYSTDNRWLLPHFEKMLYDQALIAMAYTEAFQITQNKKYKDTAEKVLAYVLRDMQSSDGGFLSAEDADSEGEEGKFYVWTSEEIKQCLSPSEADLALHVFNINKDGNYQDKARQKKSGLNIPHLTGSENKISSELNIAHEIFIDKLENIRSKLHEKRNSRIKPFKDDKILTDWNGLMIAALAKAAQAFCRSDLALAACNAANFILNAMKKEDGSLLHMYRKGNSSIKGYADDYAFMTWGLLDLFEATGKSAYLKEASNLNSYLLHHFWDSENGGFYFTPDDGESLLVRKKEIYDGALPSSNSAAMMNIIRLARMTSNPDLETKANQISLSFSFDVSRYPSAYAYFLCALDFAIGPTYEIVIVGDSRDEDTKKMLQDIQLSFLPQKVLLFVPMEMENPEIAHLIPFTEKYKALEEKATAYICFQQACNKSTTDRKEMLSFLGIKKEFQ
jgi:uncharacterized protein YyaL (SSP411 family)